MQSSPVMADPGLLNGKMGLSLYFFHLAKETGKPDHLDFAEKLLDDVYEQVQKKNIACGFGEGLAGIAWAIDTLIKEKFVEAEVDEVLSDVDDMLYQYLVNTTQFISCIQSKKSISKALDYNS